MIPNSKKIYLCAPNLSKICILNGIQTSTVDFHPQVKGYSELSFEVDRFLSIDGEFIESNGYEDLKPYMYLYLEDIGYFIMDPPQITYDGNQEIKSISAYSAEREFETRDWVGIKINYGTADSMEYSNTDETNKDEYGFANRYVTMYNEEDESLSFLSQILKKVSSKWSIGYLAPEIANAKIPFLEIDSENLYAVMTSEVGPRLSCLFIFDYLHFTINVFHKDYIDRSFDLDTGIYIGFRNLENNVSISVDSDSIYTRFTVQGEDGLEFRDVNYGDNTIINLDYFLDEPYMDDAMVYRYHAWKAFRAKYINEYIDLARQYNELVEKREERTYRVPSDEAYWKNWTNISTQGLIENLKYFRQQIELLQISVEERDPSEYLDEDGNYLPLLKDGDRLHTVPELTEGTQYKIISTDQTVTVVQEFIEVPLENIEVSTNGLIACGVDVKVGNKFIYVADLESGVDHETYLQRLYDQINIYGGYYTYKEIIDYIIKYIKMALRNTDKPITDQEVPEYEISQDWTTYGLEELKGVRDSYKDKLKALDKYSKSYEQLSDIRLDLEDLENVKNWLDGLITGKIGNIDLKDRQPWVWTEDNIWMKDDDDNYIVFDKTKVDDVDRMMSFSMIVGGCCSVVFSELLQTDGDTPIFLQKQVLFDYMEYLANKSKRSNGKVNLERFMELDRDGIKLEDGTEVKNLVFGVSNDMRYVKNVTYLLGQAVDSYEKGNINDAITYLAQIIGLELSREFFLDKTTEEAIEEVKKSADELINQVNLRNDIDLKYNDDGTGDAYENSYGRQEYKKLIEALGDEETEGSILYQIKVLEAEIADINDQLAELRDITGQYATIVQYDLDNETLESLDYFPQSVITERRFSLFTERELLTFESLLRDTDYVNSNILTTSIMSLEEKLQVEQDLLADSQDKLSEVSQPQFIFQSSVDNFFRLTDYDDWAGEFEPNDGTGVTNKPPIGLLKYIMVGLRDDYSVKLRVIGYRWNPCEITPELTLEFSNMITSRSGRSDLTQLLDQANNRGGKNSIRIGTGTADSAQEYVSALMDLLKNNSIFVKSVQNIASGTTGTADTGAIQDIVVNYLESHGVSVSDINLDNLTGLDGRFRSIATQYIDADYIASQIIDAETGYFKYLDAIKVNVNNIVGEDADFQNLTAKIVKAENATFKDIVSDVISGMTIYANTISADKITGEEAEFEKLFTNEAFANLFVSNVSTSINQQSVSSAIQQLVANNISVGQLQAGDIVLYDRLNEDGTRSAVRIISENNSMVMTDQALQVLGKREILDENGQGTGEYENYVGIQLGYGKDENPSLIIRDQSGTALFTSTGISISDDNDNVLFSTEGFTDTDAEGNPIQRQKGISANAIADQLIVDNMIHDSTISERKLGFEVIKPNDKGGIDISKVFVEGESNNFGEIWKSFKTNTESILNDVKDVGKSITLVGQQVFVESNGVITPESVTLTAQAKGGAVISKWWVDGVVTTTGLSELADNQQTITIPSSAIQNKKTLQVKVATADGTIYDIITLYRVTDGEDGQEGQDAYTIILDNENISFLADGEGMALYNQEYECNIIVYKGTERRTDFQLLTEYVVPPTGLTVTGNVYNKDVKISAKKGRYIQGNHGSIDIGVEIDSLTFIKKITYTVNKNVADGVYNWIMYSDNSRPLSTEMSPDPEGAKYIGISPNHDTAEPSGDFRDYEWFKLTNEGSYAVSMERIYHKSIYDTAKNLPAPNNEAYALAVEQGILGVTQGAIATGLAPWSIEKPEYSAGHYLWTSLKVTLNDGTVVYTSPVRSTEWDEFNAKIGGAQLIRNSKTLIDERIYWF